MWRGVTDAHLIEPGFVGSAEARKLHKLAKEQAEAYAKPARLSKSAADAAPEPEQATENIAHPVSGLGRLAGLDGRGIGRRPHPGVGPYISCGSADAAVSCRIHAR